MPGGRPTSLTPELKEKAQDFVKNYEDMGYPVPSNARLSRLLGVTVKTLYNWAERDEEFLYTLKSLKEEQESKLVEKGLDGTFSQPIAKLMLHNHGYSDKTESKVEATVDTFSSMSDDELRAFIEKRKGEADST